MAQSSSWNAFSAFQIFGDHVPMDGFSLVVRLRPEDSVVEALLESRANAQPALDPDLATMMVRSGLGLIVHPSVQFVYANPVEAVIVLHPDGVSEVGQSLEVHDQLVSRWSARMALISGEIMEVCGRVFEFPDIGVVRKAIRSAIDSYEETTPLRSAARLGTQLRGRGQPFHASMVETIEEQSHLLEQHGVDMNALPSWWWRGVAVRCDPVDRTRVELWSDLPASEELAEKIG